MRVEVPSCELVFRLLFSVSKIDELKVEKLLIAFSGGCWKSLDRWYTEMQPRSDKAWLKVWY